MTWLLIGVGVVAALAALLLVLRRNRRRAAQPADAKAVPSAPGATFVHQVSLALRDCTQKRLTHTYCDLGNGVVDGTAMGCDGTVYKIETKKKKMCGWCWCDLRGNAAGCWKRDRLCRLAICI